MSEPAVALTDYLLAILCAGLVVRTLGIRTGQATGRVWFLLLFTTVGLAAALGGTVHGFFPDPGMPGRDLLWRLTLLSLGGSALAGWMIAGHLLLAARGRRRLLTATGLLFLLYSAATLILSDAFILVIIFYTPAAVLMLIGFLVCRRRFPEQAGHSAGAWGIGVVLGASVLQASRIGLHPEWFNHNAVYHVLQCVAMLLLYQAMSSDRMPRSGGEQEC